jgi:hypothetical protein
MKKKVAAARITPDMWTILNSGGTVKVRIPADVCELRLSLHEGDENAMFDRVLSDLWRSCLRKIQKSISRNP